MSVQVYGCNHVAIEVDDVEKAVAFYKDVFNLEQMSGGEGDAFFKLGDHQFLAIFEVDKVQRANMRHFGIMVRDETQLEEVRKKLTVKCRKPVLSSIANNRCSLCSSGAPFAHGDWTTLNRWQGTRTTAKSGWRYAIFSRTRTRSKTRTNSCSEPSTNSRQ